MPMWFSSSVVTLFTKDRCASLSSADIATVWFESPTNRSGLTARCRRAGRCGGGISSREVFSGAEHFLERAARAFP
jgi:hypothetical protein